MKSYDIGYAIGSMIPFLILAGGFAILVYMLIKRSKERENETFEDRDN